MSSFYNQASWVLVPSGIEEDVVFAQKPTSGLGDLTFTRSSDATYTDASGVVRRSPYNLLQQSEMFSNAIWTKNNSTISIDTTVAPNGTLTADTLNVNATSFSGMNQLASNLNGSYTSSIYAKKGTKNWLYIVSVRGSSLRIAWFNLDTGVVGTVNSGVTATIQSVGNGWYRCTATDSITSIGNGYHQIGLSDADGSSTPASSGTAFIWGAQLVEGTEALPYFMTTNRQDVPRLDYRNADGTLSSCPRLLLEPQRTNSIRNSSMVGAVAGSPGTLPTNWSDNTAGLTRTIVGIGTESGLPYIDFRFNGTATTSIVRIMPETINQIAATNGQTWASSYYVKRVSGTFDSSILGLIMRSSAGGNLGVLFASHSITTSLTRFISVSTTNNVSTAFVQPFIDFNVTSGQNYDFTIRIAAPQMELGNFASTWVPTTTAAVTRLADTASKTGVSSLIGQTEGVLFLDIDLKNAPINFSYIMLRNAGASDYISLNWRAGLLRFETVDDNILQTSINYTATTVQTLKVAIAYKLNDFVMYVNGAQVGTDTSGTVPTCSVIDLNFVSPASNAFGIGQAALFPTRLTNDQLAQLTTL